MIIQGCSYSGVFGERSSYIKYYSSEHTCVSTRVLEREIGGATLKALFGAGVSKKLTKRRVFSRFRRRTISPSRRRDNGRRHIVKTRSSSFLWALKIDSARNGSASTAKHLCRFLSYPVLGSDSWPLGNRSSHVSTYLHTGENQVFSRMTSQLTRFALPHRADISFASELAFHVCIVIRITQIFLL